MMSGAQIREMRRATNDVIARIKHASYSNMLNATQQRELAAIYKSMQRFHKVYDECVMDDVVAQPNDVGQSQSSSSQAGNLEQLAE